MHNSITVTGVVATIPRNNTTSQGTPVTSFRLASSQRRFDRTNQCWVEGDTNWYTVTSFRRLAEHSRVSVQKGDRLIVAGRVRIRDWEKEDRSGTTVEIDADSMGHDLMWGTSTFVRAVAWNTLSSDFEPAAECEPAPFGSNDAAPEAVGPDNDHQSSFPDAVYDVALDDAAPGLTPVR